MQASWNKNAFSEGINERTKGTGLSNKLPKMDNSVSNIGPDQRHQYADNRQNNHGNNRDKAATTKIGDGRREFNRINGCGE